MSIQTGDIWYNDTYGYHVLINQQEAYPSRWWTVYVLELSEYNWYVEDDFTGPYGWVKVA